MGLRDEGRGLNTIRSVLDAIVIGAGLSGLVCARRLVEAGAKAIVLEARDRIGGRLLSGRVGGTLVDLGGQWMTAGQPRLVALAAELDVPIEKHDRSGRALLDDRGGLVAAFAQWRAMRRIERMMKAPDPAHDRQAVSELLSTIGNPTARERIALHADLTFATDPANLSLLNYLQTMRATSGFRPEAADEYRFVGGAQLLAQRMADALGDRVRLGTPVRSIDEHAANRVVLAIPPRLVRDIATDLSPQARRYVDTATTGPVVKCFAAYEHAVVGESYHPNGAVRATVASGNVRCAFVVGLEAARWSQRDPQERRAEVLAAFARFGDDPPIDYVEADWGADPWAAGCVPGLPPGALSSGARWCEPHGRVHIAGTESATRWPGYMEGAIEAGERAASEVLAAL